jgi:hypothetical protein
MCELVAPLVEREESTPGFDLIITRSWVLPFLKGGARHGILFRIRLRVALPYRAATGSCRFPSWCFQSQSLRQRQSLLMLKEPGKRREQLFRWHSGFPLRSSAFHIKSLVICKWGRLLETLIKPRFRSARSWPTYTRSMKSPSFPKSTLGASFYSPASVWKLNDSFLDLDQPFRNLVHSSARALLMMRVIIDKRFTVS